MNYLKLLALFVFAWLVNLAAPELLLKMEGMAIAESVLATSL